ncbi:hypothetical protein OF83DRAFT_1167871 [Amylostereum chailletii]|nr:hypothetical protein OF83DRAFT_1167871 [Amylostereum chailletii]
MVLFFTSTSHEPPVTIYMGKDKVENEELIKYAWPQDIWFHVDKLSSAHVYLRLPDTISAWDAIPEPLLIDCAQLVKANSIEGNKKDNLTIIYTPADNLKKTGDMAVGQVSFHNDKRVKRVHIAKRENPIVNRMNKTKVVRDVDHEAERIERLKTENAIKRAAAAQKVRPPVYTPDLSIHHIFPMLAIFPHYHPFRLQFSTQSNFALQQKAELELAKAREAEKAARSYDSLFNGEPSYDNDDDDDDDDGFGAPSKQNRSVREMEEDFM